MKQLSRVVWAEGMHLAPHHFQTQARYFEDAVHFSTSALWFANYGLSGCELDSEALRNGTVAILHARGVFPDGLPFNMPECDALPEVRNITEVFSPVQDRMTIHLSIPRFEPAATNCALPNTESGSSTRFIAEEQAVTDENTGRDEKPVHLGRKNIQIFTDDELNDGLTTLPVARVMRDGAGHFIYDTDFIPPCVQISASDRLMRLLRRLVDILEEKSSTLALTSEAGGDTASAFSRQEVASFWFLHCVNSALSTLRNLYYAKRGHPEEVFVEMSRLGGALCTFGLDKNPASLPLYDHNHLEDCFAALDEHIRFHLESVIPTSSVTIKLEPGDRYFFNGEVTDQRCLGRSQWIFAIRCDLGEADLITRTNDLVKVCSKEFVGKLVQRALPGLKMTHLQTPPTAVSPKVEFQYFSLAKSGPCWDHIVQTRQVGVYVPGDLPKPKIALQVILES